MHWRLTPRGLEGAGLRLPATIGRGGIVSDKREGDGGTPVGRHRLAAILYRPDRIPSPAPWAVPIRPRDLWCDAPDHPLYNTLAQAPLDASAETLRRADRLYDIVGVLDWNWPRAVPGRGSAIFVHRWRKPGHPTEGCIALSPSDLLRFVRLTPPGSVIEVRQP